MEPTDATVLVAGASGRTGREILEVLLDAGIEVRALTHSPEKVETLTIQGADEVVVADIMDPEQAAMAVDGVDAVLCVVGSAPSLRFLTGGEFVDGKGVSTLVDAAIAADVEHFVMESSIGVGNSKPRMPAPFRLLLRHVLNAKDEAERHLRRSGITYTILRPGGLTDGPATNDVLVGEGGDTMTGTISRADVARLMVGALFTPEARNRTFEIVSRDGSRGSPRGLVDFEWQVPEPTFAKK